MLLFIDLSAILSMHAFGAYKDLSQSCTGFAGASSSCAEDYFYGYLIFAYTIGFFLISFLVLNSKAFSIENKKSKKK